MKTNNFPIVCVSGSTGGLDGDGAAPLSGIKEVGGTTIAQKTDTAQQPDMPETAIASGNINYIVSPENITAEIVRIAKSE